MFGKKIRNQEDSSEVALMCKAFVGANADIEALCLRWLTIRVSSYLLALCILKSNLITLSLITRIVIFGGSLGVRLVGDLSTLLLLVKVGMTVVTVLTLALLAMWYIVVLAMSNNFQIVMPLVLQM